MNTIGAIPPSCVRGRRLEPVQFCEKYASKKQGEWGYKGVWRRLLAYVLGLSEKAVEEWGDTFERCPERHRKRLAEIDALKTAEDVLERHGLSKEFLKRLE